MRYNGLQLVICMAVDKLEQPVLRRFQDALVLGAIREDVLFLPGRRTPWEHWSLSHFSGRWLPGGFIPMLYPGAPGAAQRHFDAAVSAWRQGAQGAAFVQLGRASHLLIDMACPVHAQRVAHRNDGYEWYVETHCDQLRQLAFEVPAHYPSARAAVRGLARHTQRFAPDRTNHHLGQWLRACGLRRPLTQEAFSAQAEQIIPVAAGHLASVYQQFLQRTEAC